MMELKELEKYGVDIKEINMLIKKAKEDTTYLVVTGEFSAGKSCFINCLLNKEDFLPYGNTECTPILLDMYQGEESSLVVQHIDGSVDPIEYSTDNIERYARYGADDNKEVVVLGIPVEQYCFPKNIHLFDTPGTNTIHTEHEHITNYIINKADFVMYIFNKVIGASDIEHIKEIHRYTKNILFIMSHVDETNPKTEKVYSKEDIEKLLQEARKQIGAALESESNDVLIMPIGSKQGFSDREYTDEIIACVNDFIKHETSEKRKKVVKKAIEKIIDDRLQKMILERDLKSNIINGNLEEIDGKIEKYHAKKDEFQQQYQKLLKKTDSMIETKQESTMLEFKKGIQKIKEYVIDKIDNGKSEEMLENKIKQLNDNLGDEIRKYLEECFNEVIESAYNDLSVDFNDLIKEFHIDEKIVFKKPDIEEMSNSGLCAELSKVELALKENLRELKEQEENSTEEARKALQVQIREKEIQKEAVRNQLFELGGYRARYKDVENEGGEHAGKKIGRAAGEVADIALLLWNPAGAAGTAGKVLKTADTAKDALTDGKLIEKSLIVLKKGQSVVDKVKDKVEENCDETEQTELPTLLDCLSLGFWAEKVGGMIGEKIKPTTHSKIEDEEWKQQYLDQQNKIKEEINSITSDIRNREAELSEMDDYGKERRIRKELDVQRRLLQDKKDNLEKMIAQENEANKKKKEKNYYSDTIDSYLNREKQNANEMIQSAYNEFKMRLVEDMRCRCQQKIEEIEDLLDEVSCNREQKSSQIDMLDADIEQLKSGKEDIEKWLSV